MHAIIEGSHSDSKEMCGSGNSVFIQKAERSIRDVSGAILLPRNRANRIQKAYQHWKKKVTSVGNAQLPHPSGMIPIHPPFLESVSARIKKALERGIARDEDIVHLLTVRTADAPYFRDAFSRAFDDIEEDETFDSRFLLSNLTEELNAAIRAICNKEQEFKELQIIRQEVQHVIDNDDLIGFVLKRLINGKEVDMKIRLNDYRKVIRTFACFKRDFMPVLINKLGENKAMFLIELIRKYCDPKTESVSMYNLITACEEFHRMTKEEESQAGGKI